MKRILIASAIALLLIGCSTERQCACAAKRCGMVALTDNVWRIREGYEAEPLALGSFLLYAVIGCSSFGINNLKNNIK